MLKNKLWIGILLFILLSVFTIPGFALYYKYTMESGANFYVSIADKADALENHNEIRQILDDLGNLLVHSKRNDLYPKDKSTGGTLSIPNSALALIKAGAKGDILYCSAANVWSKLNVGADNQLLVVSTDTVIWETLASDLLSDVASIAMLDEAETITGNWVNTDFPWADNEVADDITVTNYYPKTEIDSQAEMETIWGVDLVVDGDLADYYLKTAIDTQGEVETIWGVTLATDAEVAAALADYYLKVDINTQGEVETIWGVALVNDGDLDSYYLKTAIDTQGEVETIWGTTLCTDAELAAFTGSANIVTLGTIVTGIWNSDVVGPVYGGTGIANDVLNTLTFTGAYSLGLTLTANTSLTLPTSGTLATTGDLHDEVTLGTASGLSLIGQELSLAINSDTSAGAVTSGSGQDSKAWKTDAFGVPGWRTDLGGEAFIFLDATDTPITYAGQGGKFVRVAATEDAVEFYVIAGGGDVFGPSTSVDHSIVRFAGTDNKTIQDSLAIIDDNGSITIPAGQFYKIDGVVMAASGANTDITSITGLTTPLAIAYGGTGSVSAGGARTALGLAIGTDVQAEITGADTYVLFFDGLDNPAGDAGMTYNKTTNTLSVDNFAGDGSGLTGVGVGQATALTISARAEEDIDKGEVVYISGATGQTSDVSLADNTDTTKHIFCGVAAETKTAGQSILIRVRGELIGVDTSTFVNGDPLYLSTAGAMTKVIPTSGAVEIIGYVRYANVAGKILIMHHSAHGVYVPSTDDIIIRMGASDGSKATIFKNYANTEVAKVDDQGDADFNSLILDTALPAIEGGTGKATITADSFLKGAAGNTYVERTIAQVLIDLSLNNVENTALSTWAGTENITTLGTIATGVWQGTAINDIYIPNDITIDLATLATTATTANAGDAAVDFFGAGVDAVTDTTECTDLEGTALSITEGTLNVTEADPTVDSDAKIKAILVDEVTKTGDFTAGRMAIINNASGIIEQGTNTDTDVADAVTKKHAANADTDLDGTFEATFVKKVDTVNVLADITSTGANIEDAVTKKHTQNTDTAAGGEWDFGANSAGFTIQTAGGDGTTTINWTLGNYFKFTHGAMAETFTFNPAPTKPGHLTLIIIQDGVGGRDCTWPAPVKWLGDEPTWTDGGAGKGIVMAIVYDGTSYWSQGTPWEL